MTKTIHKPALIVLTAIVAAGFFLGGFFWRGQLDDRPAKEAKNVQPLPKTGYASVNGLKMYYEIRGSGQPLVLLHGALSTIGLDYGRMLPTLAKHHRVIAIEQQGHGHTADIDRPLTYEQMAKDTAALLKQLKVAKADVIGYSMGGNIALQLAMQQPDLVRKLTVISPYFNNDGLHPEILESQKQLGPEALKGSSFEKVYAQTAPHPDQWPTLIAKIKHLNLEVFKGWPAEDIKAIAAPTLVIAGDSDITRPEHDVELFRLRGGGVPGDIFGLPAAQLAILPGATHIAITEHSDMLLGAIEPFLAKK